MDLGIEGRVAIVTGGSKGIGRGIAESLASEGCHVVICARTAEEVEATAEELRAGAGDDADGVGGPEILAITADLTKEEDRERLVERTLERFEQIDILVNNAGTVGDGGTLHETTLEMWRDLFELNLFAVVDLTRRIVPRMREQGWGRIVNVSSENGQQPYPDMIHYSASKGALDNFSKGLSKAYADDGILVNTVSPAFIMTPLVEEMMESAAEKAGEKVDTVIDDVLEEARPHIELDRPGRIEEVGPVVAFLCSDLASFVNGANYRVDGGSVASI